MKEIIIYGTGELAKLAHYYLVNDSNYEVIAFCVDNGEVLQNNSFCSLPVIPFENVEIQYSADKYAFFAPINSEKMNTVKEAVFNKIKDKGYQMISYISSKAIIYNTQVGENCFIQAGNVIHPFTKIGSNVTMWSSNLIAHKSEIKDHVTFASHVALAAGCLVEENSYLGTNATIRDGIKIAKGTLVGMGALISRDTEEWSVYMGNPSKKIGNNISKSILKI